MFVGPASHIARLAEVLRDGWHFARWDFLKRWGPLHLNLTGGTRAMGETG